MEQTVTIPVFGMSCEHCVRAVKEALSTLSGVKNVEVSLEERSAKVIYDDEHARVSEMETAILEEGYQIKEE